MDWDKIKEAIADEPIIDFDRDNAADCVRAALDKWLERDQNEFHVTAVEQKIETDFNGHTFKGFMDLCGTLIGNHKTFQPYQNQPFILDWKTSKNTLDSTWRWRQIDSWQSQLYSHFYNKAPIFIFRGVSRNLSTAEIILETSKTNDAEVEQYLTAHALNIDALWNSGLQVFPRNKPFACNAYGRECKFYESCTNNQMPLVLPAKPRLSYTFLNDWMLCQEKARRQLIDGHQESEESRFGSAVHRGLAEAYRQAFSIPSA